MLDGAIGTSEIEPLFDLFRQNIVTEFTPVRSVMGGSVDINQTNAQVYIKDVAGAVFGSMASAFWSIASHAISPCNTR